MIPSAMHQMSDHNKKVYPFVCLLHSLNLVSDNFLAKEYYQILFAKFKV